MTTMTRFVPFRSPLQDMAVLQNRLNSIFHDFNRSEGEESLGSGSFVPAVDIFEDNQRIVLTLEVPGVQQKDLNLHIENNLLTVRGERKFESAQKEENYHRIERRFGTFSRSFTLPQTIDADAVNANHDAGLLTITLGKKAEAKPRQVNIQIGSVQAPKQVEATPEAKQVATAQSN